MSQLLLEAAASDFVLFGVVSASHTGAWHLPPRELIETIPRPSASLTSPNTCTPGSRLHTNKRIKHANGTKETSRRTKQTNTCHPLDYRPPLPLNPFLEQPQFSPPFPPFSPSFSLFFSSPLLSPLLSLFFPYIDFSCHDGIGDGRFVGTRFPIERLSVSQ